MDAGFPNSPGTCVCQSVQGKQDYVHLRMRQTNHLQPRLASYPSHHDLSKSNIEALEPGVLPLHLESEAPLQRPVKRAAIRDRKRVCGRSSFSDSEASEESRDTDRRSSLLMLSLRNLSRDCLDGECLSSDACSWSAGPAAGLAPELRPAS